MQALQIGQSTTVLLKGRNPELPQSEPSPPPPSPVVSNFIWETLFCGKSSSVLAPPPTFPPSPKMPNRAVSCPPSSCTSFDDCKCSFLPFGTRVPPHPGELEGWAYRFSPRAGPSFPHPTNKICAHLLIMTSRLSPPAS